MLGYAPKYTQMHQLFRWLSHDTLLAEAVDCSVWTTVLPRLRPDGRLAVAILNLSHDDAPALTVRLRTNAESVRIIRNQQPDEIIPCSADCENALMKRIKVAIKPFELVYILGDFAPSAQPIRKF